MSNTRKAKPIKTRVVHRKMGPQELIDKGTRMVGLIGVHESYKSIPAEFVQVGDIESGTQNLATTHLAVTNGNKTLIDTRDLYQDILDDDIFHFGLYAQLLGRKDPNALINTGLDLIQVGGGRSSSGSRSRANAPTAVPMFHLQHAPHSGSLLGTVSGIAGVVSFEVYWAPVGDPALPESWVYYNVYAKSSKFEITGLEPGKVYYFKVRGVNAHGVSPWSAIVSIRAL